MKKVFYVFLFSVSISSAIAQQNTWLDIKESTVLEKEVLPAGPSQAQKNQKTINLFSELYVKQGRPGIAILWNRKFADVFSAWQADSRQTSETIMTGRPIRSSSNNGATTKDSESSDVNCSWHYKSHNAGDCRHIERNYTEHRRQDDPEKNEIEYSSKLEETKFNTGYSQTFLSAGAQVIDRSTIMRLVERKQHQERGSATSPDYYRIEADALIGHADYLAEVLLAGEDPEHGGQQTYSVSIKDIKTGQILAMLFTNGFTNEAEQTSKVWVATNNGYEQQNVSQNQGQSEKSNLGKAVALETMQALNKLWLNSH